MLTNIINQSWQVFAQMSPYLLLGFFVAGVLSVCISPEWVQRHLGRKGFRSVLKASLFGIPLPLCSCGVIPVSTSIRRHGASRAATTAFLLSTPQTGVDSIAVTYALLGSIFAIFRPIAALLTGLVGGLLVQTFSERDETETVGKSSIDANMKSCYADENKRSFPIVILRYGFITLPRDIGPALLIGTVVAGAMAELVPPDHLNAYIGGGILSMLLLMAAGVPIYVCATASVPIAAGFMHMGASPGAALSFLIAGPATNAAAFTTIWKVLGRRTAILHLITVAISAVACGLLLDRLVVITEATLPQLGDHAHTHAEGGWFCHASAIVLLAVLVISYMVTSRYRSENIEKREAADEMSDSVNQQRLQLRVTGMTCSHCAASLKNALADCAGVLGVKVDLKSGHAVVAGRDYDPEQLAATVEGLGYKVEDKFFADSL